MSPVPTSRHHRAKEQPAGDAENSLSGNYRKVIMADIKSPDLDHDHDHDHDHQHVFHDWAGSLCKSLTAGGIDIEKFAQAANEAHPLLLASIPGRRQSPKYRLLGPPDIYYLLQTCVSQEHIVNCIVVRERTSTSPPMIMQFFARALMWPDAFDIVVRARHGICATDFKCLGLDNIALEQIKKIFGVSKRRLRYHLKSSNTINATNTPPPA